MPVVTNKYYLDTELAALLQLCEKNLPGFNRELIKSAFEYASIAHGGDVRASQELYFSHPIAVARILATEIPFDDVSVACGLLHDVVEDNENYTIEMIKKSFGSEIATIVEGLTKIKNIYRGSEIEQSEHYRRLLISITKDIRVIIVKFADRLNNMRTLEFLKPDKRKRIAKETLEIYAPLAHRFGLGKLKWELEDLSFKELNLQAYEEIKKKINSKRQEREQYIEKFTKPITEKLKERNYKYEISGRVKHLYSIYRKMIRRNKPFEEIYDLFAVRIILDSDYSDDCYHIFGLVNNIYLPVPGRFKDYISIPKTNNYRSLHTTVVGPEGNLVEVQIRTKKMHDIAEQGVAAHWKYKEGTNENNPDLNRYISWIRGILENTIEDDMKKNVVETFKLDLYSDEIYVFTPQGDLKRLPLNSTPVDFAFEVHSNIGHHCIGAKVNQRIVPLDTILQSGDQVEIITSKNQHPNKNWLKFVKTHKAKTEIKRWLNKADEAVINAGKEAVEKKLKKSKLPYTQQDLNRIAISLKFDNLKKFYKAIGEGKLTLDEVIESQMPKKKEVKMSTDMVEIFTNSARASGGQFVVDGEKIGMKLSYSKCCNPIPGDFVVGYVTIGEGIKVHRVNCKNLLEISKKEPEKLVSIRWPELEGASFIVGLKVKGEDSPGLLSEISNVIVTYKNTNIKSINIDTTDSLFEGVVTLYVQSLDHLSRIIERLKKIKGMYTVTRLEVT
ncbi:MAG: bifunctional (p)ppGpp synthetase/guanosine-3',5'-bis(diphosphate) 3'-pyrophosphohydrolase [Ignavibacteriaceae bacterium]|nr:bifunctional (p)ppGpp synthetase/guanosine-3',5'-bis(diphosphate) 3'-pyrophosphohydrolase [Ignavibacteriaceae bacterium]